MPKTSLNPYYVSGLVEREGSFTWKTFENNAYKAGWGTHPLFHIVLHSIDKELLEKIQIFFGAFALQGKGQRGYSKIYVTKDKCDYVVQSINEIRILLDHFDKYPLITEKKADYILFKGMVDLIIRKEHLTSEGLQKIVNFKAALNRGLSNKMWQAFPKTIPVERPKVLLKSIPDPNWLVGFVDGEGSFVVTISLNSNKSGFRVRLEFSVCQHLRDEELMNQSNRIFRLWKTIMDSRSPLISFRVKKFSDIIDIIIPFFKKYPLQSVKNLNFMDFCKVAEIMKVKGHLTVEGLEEVRDIRNNMNTKRNYDVS